MGAAEVNSERERDDDDDAVESGTSPTLPTAVVVPPRGDAAAPDPTRWVRRGIFLGALAIGWTFIVYINRFTFSAPTVFVCLAYLALVSTGYALWRTGVVVVTEDGDEADSTWGRPIGRRAELEREKKTLLKAIKEAEFDREMGKLSKADAEEMIAVYRVRAIEVIKEIDQMDAGSAGTVREQIERELKARLEIDAKADRLKADAQADATKDKKKKEAAKKGSAKGASKKPDSDGAKAEGSTTDGAKAEGSTTDANVEASNGDASKTSSKDESASSKDEPAKDEPAMDEPASSKEATS